MYNFQYFDMKAFEKASAELGLCCIEKHYSPEATLSISSYAVVSIQNTERMDLSNKKPRKNPFDPSIKTLSGSLFPTVIFHSNKFPRETLDMHRRVQKRSKAIRDLITGEESSHNSIIQKARREPDGAWMHAESTYRGWQMAGRIRGWLERGRVASLWWVTGQPALISV